MAKVGKRHRRRPSYATAYRRSFLFWCLEAGTTPAEIRFLAEDNEEAKARLLSLQELAENDARPYKRTHTNGGA